MKKTYDRTFDLGIRHFNGAIRGAAEFQPRNYKPQGPGTWSFNSLKAASSPRLSREALRSPSVRLARQHKRSRQICPPISVPGRDFRARHGFAADRVFLYGRQNILSGTYLNDIQRQSSRFINPKPVRELLEDKLLFGTLVAPIARVPASPPI